eukprot:UN24046
MLTTIVNGEYVLGIYAAENISFGQELGFDYNAVTESEAEWKGAICLCGNRKCRGNYLDFAGSTAFQEVIRKHHTLLHRLALLYRTIDENFTDDDTKKLAASAVGSSLLRNVPGWLKKYVSFIVDFVNEEKELLPKLIMQEKRKGNKGYEDYDQESADLQAVGVVENRKVSVAITLDKIQHVIYSDVNKKRAARCPLRRLTYKEIISNLWSDQDSLLNCLIKCLRVHGVKTIALEKLKKDIEPLPFTREGLTKVKAALLMKVYKFLKQLEPSQGAKHHAAADLLYFYANTRVWFTSDPFEPVESKPLSQEHLGKECYRINR